MPIMPKFMSVLPIVAALVLATPVFAQESTTDSTTTNIEDQLSIGQEAGAPQIGQTYVKENIGDWELRCVRGESDQEHCELYQLLKDEDGIGLAEIVMFRLPEGGEAVAGATIVVPLETLLTAQLAISVDGSNPLLYPYLLCDKIGCYARIGLTKNDIDSFKKGAAGKVMIVPALAPDQKIELTLSLKGFTKGYGQVGFAIQ